MLFFFLVNVNQESNSFNLTWYCICIAVLRRSFCWYCWRCL